MTNETQEPSDSFRQRIEGWFEYYLTQVGLSATVKGEDKEQLFGAFVAGCVRGVASMHQKYTGVSLESVEQEVFKAGPDADYKELIKQQERIQSQRN